MRSLVQSLYIYPIKSTSRISLVESEVADYGLSNDRVFAFINAHNHILTARENPNLLSLNCMIKDQILLIRHPSLDIMELSLDLVDYSDVSFTLFRDTLQGQVITTPYDSIFSEILGEACQLIQLDPKIPRKIKEKHGGSDNDVLKLSDAGPILLLSEESLADLNNRLNNPITMERFRPNIVINGIKPYGEDSWQYIRIGACEFKVAKACKRCVFITIDPATLIKDKNQEPLRTLTTYRQSDTGGVTFGMCLIPRSAGRIKVGDEVEILE